MRRNQIAAGAVIVGLLFTLPIPAGARNRNDVQLRGVVVSLDSNGRGFMLRQPRGGGRFWTVRMTGHTRILAAASDEEDEDDDDDANRDIIVGDIVRVDGHFVGNGRIIADEIRIFGHVDFPGVGQPPIGILPVPPHLFLTAPEIFFPANGAEIVSSEVSIVGRTVPGAAVHIDVTFQAIGLLPLGSTAADVVADSRGVFSATIRLPVRFPGATYRITVAARLNGTTSPETSIVVRHI